MINLVCYLAAIIAILAAAVKLAQVRRQPHTPGLRYLCGVLVCLGLSAATVAPATLQFGSHIEPTPNLTRLVGNILALAALFCLLRLLAQTVRPADAGRTARQLLLLAAAVVAMTALLLAAHTRFTVDFVNVYAGNPLIVAYEIVFLSYGTWGLMSVLLLEHRIAARPGRATLRAGLRLVEIGTALGLSWALWKIAMTLTKAITRRPVPLEAEVSALLSAISIALFALGATMTTWGPRAAHPLLWLRTFQLHRRIKPLWTALNAALPELEFRQPGAGMDFRLYHRIVEIRDANLALRVYFHPAVRSWVETATCHTGITDEIEIAVLTDAANIAAALTAHAAGHRFHADPSTAAVPHEIDADIQAEARWLVRVSDAFVRSPIVESVRWRVVDEVNAAGVSDRESPSV